MQTQPPPADRVFLIALFQNHLLSLQDVQAQLVTQMTMSPAAVSLDVGELLEDIANRYLDMSDMISACHSQARQGAPASQVETMSEHPAAG